MPLPEFRLKVTVEASVGPSEDPEKVKAAEANILGECGHHLEEGRRTVRMTSEEGASLRRLHDQLRDRHVRAVARKLLLVGRTGNRSTLMLNRQAAFVGVLALCGSEVESPLGPVYLTIESDELDNIIQWLTSYETG